MQNKDKKKAKPCSTQASKDIEQAKLKAEGLTEIHWRVRIQVGLEGVPTGAHVLEAPEFLRSDLVDAAMMWSFEPVVVEKQAQSFKYLWEHRWVPL